MRETRPAVLLHHINLATVGSNARTTFKAYATAVRDIYNERTPIASRAIDFHTTRDPYTDERLNAQIVRRALDDADRLPCALEEALMLALPEPMHSECLRELAARYGQLSAAIPSGHHGAALIDAATLMRETGEALADLAQCFDGGNNLKPNSATQIRRAVGNLDDVAAAVETLRARLTGSFDSPSSQGGPSGAVALVAPASSGPVRNLR